MKLGMLAAAGLMLTSLALGLGGCEKNRDELRPDMDKVVSGDRNLQSRDLREMTDRMAPDLLQIPEIVQNPYKVVVVMKSIENKTENEPTRNYDIYVARLKTLLNSSKTRDKIAFVEERQTLERLQGQELGNPDPMEDASRTGQPVSQRVKPQYALKGVFYSKYDGRTSYFLCTFQLTDLRTGVQVWEGSYEVRTLN